VSDLTDFKMWLVWTYFNSKGFWGWCILHLKESRFWTLFVV
jgi:hypothetical protein